MATVRLAPLLIEGPAIYPVSRDEAKAHLRIDIDDEDALIDALIVAATGYLDGRNGVLGESLITQTWQQSFPSFCDLRLPLGPVQSIDAISYYDGTGDSQVLSTTEYRLLTDVIGPKVALVPGGTWPTTYCRDNAVTVEFTAGYGDEASDVPAPLRQAILLLIGHWYENREPTAGAAMSGLWNQIPLTVDALISLHRPIRV